MKFDIEKQYEELVEKLGLDKNDMHPEDVSMVKDAMVWSVHLFLINMEDLVEDKSEKEGSDAMNEFFNSANEQITNYFLKLGNNFN